MNTRKQNLALFGAVILYTFPFYLASLKCFFHPDDFFNLYLYIFQPFYKLLISNFVFWNTTYRPLGGILYWMLFHVFGLEPLPYYILGNLLRIANLGLVLFLLLRITKSPLISLFVTAISAIHWETSNAIYNFGAIYELLAFCFFLVSFHFYISFKQSGKSLTYLAALSSYIFALNGKEMAVTLPIILAAYDIIYRRSENNLRKVFVQLIPFFVVGVIFSVGKLYGANAYLADPTFAYKLDWEAFNNFKTYIEMLFYGRIQLSAIQTTVLLLGALIIAGLLRNKNMLFGGFYFLITLLPVIGLRRVWGLYLYIPILGIALYGASFLAELIQRTIRKPINPTISYITVIALLALAGVLQYPKFMSATEKHFIQPGNERRILSSTVVVHVSFNCTRYTACSQESPFIGFGIHHCVLG